MGLLVEMSANCAEAGAGLQEQPQGTVGETALFRRFFPQLTLLFSSPTPVICVFSLLGNIPNISTVVPFLKGGWVTKTRILRPKSAEPITADLDHVPSPVAGLQRFSAESHSLGPGTPRMLLVRHVHVVPTLGHVMIIILRATIINQVGIMYEVLRLVLFTQYFIVS